jgi:hypothetical protein
VDRRSTAARGAGLVLVAFVATIALLIGGWVLVARLGSAGPRPSATSVSGPSPTARASATPVPTVPPPAGAAASDAPTFVLSGAGDIADCSLDAAQRTSDLLLEQPGWVFTAGDNAYEDGSATDYARCYGPTWGRVLDRTILPAPGNHDWQTKGAAGYRDYFGARATPDGTTWYATTIGTWHIVVLDSDCGAVGGCGPDSPQGQWLKDDLEASRQACTLAIWHHPRWSSGEHGNDREVGPFWDLLYARRADLVINGHDHDYERFGPQDPAGVFDRARGIREIVVGTGGAGLRDFTHGAGNAESRIAGTFGVLRLTLHPTGYDWAFLAVDGSVKDSGSSGCH